MSFLRLCLLVAMAALAAGTFAPAQAQFFSDPRTEVLPPKGQTQAQRPPPRPRRQQNETQRQYIPPQPEQSARRPSFFERLFPRLGMPAPQWSEPPEARPRRVPNRAARPDRPAERADRNDADPAAPPRRRVQATTFVAVLGDSLADNLAGGLTEALAEQPEVGLVREIRPGTGFLKDTDRSWKSIADGVLARDPPVVAAVVLMGPQDDPVTPARKAATAAETAPGISPWTDLYAARVDDITLSFRQKGIPLLWVGLPPVDDPVVNADNAFVNELVQQRVTALGATFIDVWEGFVDSDENFAPQGPDLEGSVVRLRTADGLHFTKAGARKLAHYVELELRSLLLPKEEGSAMADVAKEISAVPLEPGSSRILLLGDAPRAPGAVLVPAATSAPGPEVEIAARALRTGETLPAKPGRADDFAWPAAN